MSADNRPPVTEREVQAYMDGQIDPGTERAGVVEAYLAANPDARARAQAYRAQDEAIRARFRDVLAEPVPERLRVENLRSNGTGRARKLLHSPARFAAGLVVACCAAFIGWLAGQPENPSLERFSEQVSARLAQPTDDPLSSPATLQSLSALGGAPDFTAEGLELVGARQVDNGDMYESRYLDRSGRELRLFVAPDPQRHDNLLSRTETGGHEVVYWKQGPLMYALTGDYSRRRLDDFAHAAIERLEHGIEAGRLADSEREAGPPLLSGSDEVTAAQSAGSSQTVEPEGGGLDPGHTGLDSSILQLQSGGGDRDQSTSSFQ